MTLDSWIWGGGGQSAVRISRLSLKNYDAPPPDVKFITHNRIPEMVHNP